MGKGSSNEKYLGQLLMPLDGLKCSLLRGDGLPRVVYTLEKIFRLQTSPRSKGDGQAKKIPKHIKPIWPPFRFSSHGISFAKFRNGSSGCVRSSMQVFLHGEDLETSGLTCFTPYAQSSSRASSVSPSSSGPFRWLSEPAFSTVLCAVKR